MKNIIVCNTDNDSLTRINIDRMSVDTLPLKLGGEKIGPISIDVKGERGVIANCYSDSITFINTRKFIEENNFLIGKYPNDIKWKDDYIYVTCGDSNSLIIFNEKEKRIDFEIKVGDYPNSISIDSEKKYVYVSNMNSNSITIIDNETKKVEREIYLKNSPTKIYLSKDKKNIYVCENTFEENMKGKLKIYSLNDFSLLNEYNIGAFPIDIFEKDGFVYSANFGDGSIRVVNLKNKDSYKFILGGMPREILKIDENIIVSDYYSGRIFIIDENTMHKKIIALGN